MLQVFGKTMMCKDHDVATSVAQRDNLDGILMDGTQVSKKGVHRGGYYDKSRQALMVAARLMKRLIINENKA